ncbi:MAG: nucleotidyltransferase domain-containing protein [Candidatus Cloacimonetes bacterium]|nr:nucleotidyltransferase domain-containing protein [Candidatus Cloacimonadota bacterium]
MAKKTTLKKSIKSKIEKFYSELKEAGFSVREIILFGSQAKGDAKDYSDIDLAVISNSFGKDYLEEMMALKKLASKVDFSIEPHPLTPVDLKEEFNPLADEVRKWGIRVI